MAHYRSFLIVFVYSGISGSRNSLMDYPDVLQWSNRAFSHLLNLAGGKHEISLLVLNYIFLKVSLKIPTCIHNSHPVQVRRARSIPYSSMIKFKCQKKNVFVILCHCRCLGPCSTGERILDPLPRGNNSTNFINDLLFLSKWRLIR